MSPLLMVAAGIHTHTDSEALADFGWEEEAEEEGGGGKGRWVWWGLWERSIPRQRRNLCPSESMSPLCSRLSSVKDSQRPACSTSGSNSAGLPPTLLPHYSMLQLLNGRQSWTSVDRQNGDKQFDFSCAFKSFLAFAMVSLFFTKSVFICNIFWACFRCFLMLK